MLRIQHTSTFCLAGPTFADGARLLVYILVIAFNRSEGRLAAFASRKGIRPEEAFRS